MCYSLGVWSVLKVTSMSTEVLIGACAATFLVNIEKFLKMDLVLLRKLKLFSKEMLAYYTFHFLS